MVQIAGIVARRIISRVRQGDSVRRGEKMGMICFGSRLDVYLPETSRLVVKKGEKVRSGSSVLGYLK
jgi:phosphatidylserine decarboxylase